jgi:hypothetical protein
MTYSEWLEARCLEIQEQIRSAHKRRMRVYRQVRRTMREAKKTA